MKNLHYLILACLLVFPCKQKEAETIGPLTPVPFTAVHLTDQFWTPKIEINRTISIPSAFGKYEENGRMDNFALAGGLIEGEHQGDFPFGDTDKSYFYWWLKEGSQEWVDYEFDEPTSLSQSSVYWLNMDHYDGNYRVPGSWSLLYKDSKSNWVPVETNDQYTVETDQYNTVWFKPIKTKAIRIQAQLQENQSAGILEWKVQ